MTFNRKKKLFLPLAQFLRKQFALENVLLPQMSKLHFQNKQEKCIFDFEQFERFVFVTKWGSTRGAVRGQDRGLQGDEGEKEVAVTTVGHLRIQAFKSMSSTGTGPS